ncbi:MAG: hypothetical protein ABW170_00820 [Candidatus Thiodiazotropha sp. L084R]
MKWELWQDQEGCRHYIIAHPVANSLRKRLPEGSEIVWSCEAYSTYDAQYQHLSYQKAWFRKILLRIDKVLKPTEYKDTYKDMGWE